MAGCILGSQYIPSVEYFAHWVHHGIITLEMHEHYQKRTWRNKAGILGPDKPLVLTVPLQKGKHQQMMIRDVKISFDEHWNKIHLNSFKSAYGKTAFFEEIVQDLEQIFNHPPETLWDLNLQFITWISSLIPGDWKIEMTGSYVPTYLPPVVDLRKGIPAGISAFPLGVQLTYPQVQRLHKIHQPNLCILDALCHLGPDTHRYLDQYAAKLYDNLY